MAQILVIDHDRIACDSCSLSLQHARHETRVAYSGAAGLRSIHGGSIDLVLTDLLLGDATAIDLLKQLRAENLHVPVIVCTAAGAVPTAVDAMRWGASDYLLKPLDFQELLKAIDRALRQPPHDQAVDTQIQAHAATRWAAAVAGVIQSAKDIKTIAAWGHVVGISAGALRNRCEVAGFSARRSLLLGRLLRAVLRSTSHPWVPHQMLDVADRRTLDRLLAMGGCSRHEAVTPTVEELLTRQRLIDDQMALAALRAALCAMQKPPSKLTR